MAKMGRPSKYTEELGTEICTLYAEGTPLREIAKKVGLNASTIIDWSINNEQFSKQYARAQQVRTEMDCEEIREVAFGKPTHEVPDPDGGTSTRIDPAGVNRNRLIVDTLKWIMARRLPKKYGEKVEQYISGPDGGPIQAEIKVELVKPSVSDTAS